MGDTTIVLLMFMGGATVIALLSLLIQRVEWRKLKKASKEQGILAGIGAAFVVTIIAAGILTFAANKAAAYEVSYFNYVELDVGLLYTKKISPQCKATSDYNKATSDLRITGNFLRVESDNSAVVFEVNGDYLHHSCELGEDRNSFDGIGPKARIRFNF